MKRTLLLLVAAVVAVVLFRTFSSPPDESASNPVAEVVEPPATAEVSTAEPRAAAAEIRTPAAPREPTGNTAAVAPENAAGSARAAVDADAEPLPEAAPVVVPESYPVSEAGQYFVPRSERRVGNLGGPPPPDFPPLDQPQADNPDAQEL